MTPAHLHLVLNHVPAIGVVFAGMLFVVARLKGSAPFQRVALWFLVVSALTAIPVYLTGDSAEDAVDNLPGMVEALVERHEEAAGVAFAAVEVTGGLALLAALLFRRTADLPRALAAGVAAVVIATTGLFGWAGYLGGQIRHSEIRSGAAVADAGDVAGRADGRDRGEHDDD